MTRLLPTDAREGRRLKRLRTAFFFEEPSDSAILERMRLRSAERGEKRLSFVRPRRWAPVAWGALIGLFLSGGAFGWGVHSGRLILTTAPVDDADRPAAQAPKFVSPNTFPAPELRDSVQENPTGSSPKEAAPDAEGEDDAASRTDSETKDRSLSKVAPRLTLGVSPPSGAPTDDAPTDDAPTDDAPAVRALWTEVAEALREGDTVRANGALSRLRESGDDGVSQAARVLELQLHLRARGELTDVELTEVEILAASAPRATIRTSARRLLDEVRERKINVPSEGSSSGN